MNQQILQGQPVPNELRGSTVRILVDSDGTLEGFCSGVVVDSRWVLTASHCLDVSDKARIRIVAGDGHSFADQQNVTCTTEALGPKDDAIELEAVEILHIADLALLRTVVLLPGELRIHDRGDANPNARGEYGALGYGVNEENTLGVLDFIPLELVFYNGDEVWLRSIKEGGVCIGDSGGPLFERTAEGWSLVGVLSRGATDCTGPDLFTCVVAPVKLNKNC